MEKELVGGGFAGEKGKYAVAFKDGHLQAEVDFALSGVEGSLKVALGAEAVLTALKEAIPGHFDDAVLDAAIALLKS